MIAGHAYRDDGWCREAKCLRHRSDPPDYGECPDSEGFDLLLRNDLPPEKLAILDEQRRRRWAVLGAALLRVPLPRPGRS